MSVINKMLQDLDRRQALGAVAESGVVRASTSKPDKREWFWRCLVVLLAAALGWVGWVVIQLMPRQPLVTDLAFQAAAEAQSRAKPAPAVAPAPEPAQSVPAPLQEPKPEEKAALAEPQPAPSAETLRLARQLETPVQEKATKPKARPAVERAEKVAKVEKRERAPVAAEDPQAHFRRARIFLSHGWVGDAEEQFAAALRADPKHTAAREGYVALLLDQQRVSVAQRVLQDGLAINPGHPAFAIALARIYAAQGRHQEAVEAYQDALRNATQPAATWIGLGTSLEALGRRSDAVLAYRRALTAGPLAAEAREYAEARTRALE